MEGNDKKEVEGDGIIYDSVQGKYICVLCKPSKSKTLTAEHRFKKEHVTRQLAFYNAFVVLHKQPFCTSCDKTIAWEKVQEHAMFHEITPYWDPPTKILTFFANYVTRACALYHCHLCDRTMVHWADAWSHLDDEGHLELQRKAGKQELAKKWMDHLSKWHRQGITLGPKNRLECRMCEITMEPGEAESHMELSEHARRKLLFDESVAKRVKNGEFIESSKTRQIPKSSEQMTLKPSTDPSPAGSSTSLQSERVDSSHENELDDGVSMNSIATESSPMRVNVFVTKKQRAEYHSLVFQSSWITEPQHPQFDMNFPDNRREDWPANAAKQLHFCLLCRKDFSSKKAAKKHKSSSEHVNSLKKYGTDYLIVTEQGSFFCTCCENLRTPLWRICSHMMTKCHLETVENVNRKETVEAENKSKESEAIDSVKSQPCSKDPDRCLTSFGQEIGPSGEEPKPLDENLRSNGKPPVPSLTNVPTIDPGPSINPEISSALAKKSSNFSTAEMNSNWIFATSDALFGRLISPELGSLLVIDDTKESFYCIICFKEFLHIEIAMEHISGDQHVNAKKIYGCDFIARTRKKGFYCKCCHQREQQLDKIYNHLLSSSHAQRLITKSEQIDSDSVSVQAEHSPKKSEISTKDAGVSQSFSKSSDQSSSEPKKYRASESRKENSEILKRQPNWIVGSSSLLYKNLVPKQIRESLNDVIRRKFRYCFVCSKYFFEKETADKHISSEQHLNTMKKHGFDLIVMNQTGQYHCMCCDQPAGNNERVYRHPMTKRHVQHLREYNQRKDEKIDGKNFENAFCKEATPLDEQPECIVENLPKTIEPEDPLCSNFCPVDSGQSLEPKVAKKERINSSFLETNWIVKVTKSGLYRRMVPVNRRQQCPKNTEKTFFYCLVCLEHLCGIETVLAHVSCKKHAKSTERWGCHCIEKIKETSYRCSRCERETKSFERIYNHLTSEGHAKRGDVVGEAREKNETNDIGDSRSTSEDLQTVLTNSRSSRDNSCDKSEPKSVTPENVTENNAESSTELVDKETDQNFEFFETELNWVVDVVHPLFPRWKIKNIKKEMAKKIKKTYCVICQAFFCRPKTAQRHIASEKHENMMKLRGCNYIEVTEESKFRCTCCSSKKMVFEKIYSHVIDEKHGMKLREIEGEDRELLLKSEPNAATNLNVGYLDSALNWLISPEHSMFIKSFVKSYGKAKENTSQRSFYCLICNWPCDGGLMDVDEAREHIASSLHAGSIEQYGCDFIRFDPNYNYLCTACNCTKNAFPQIFTHVNKTAHLRQVCLVRKKKEEKRTVHREQTESSEATINESLVDQPIDEDSKAKEESNNYFPSNVIEIDSQSSLVPEILPTAEKTAEDLDFLQTDFPWIIHASNGKVEKLNPENVDVNEDDGKPGERFCCSLCLTVLYGPKMAIDHISGEQHAKSIKKFGCQHIFKVKNIRYLCTCCGCELINFSQTRKHVLSDGHLKRLRLLNPENNEIVEQRIDENFEPSPINLAPIEEIPRQESQSRNCFPKNFLGPNPQTSLDPKTCTEAEETIENAIFFARDLDWVIDKFHVLFPLRTVKKPHEKLASHTGDQIFHCLVCLVDFPDAKTIKNHISGEQHRNSLIRFGCNEIRVTPKLNYRCEFCQYETKTFLNIYAHVMSDQHAKILREGSRQTSLPFCAAEKARALENNVKNVGPSFCDTGAFSFDWPTPQEQYTPSYEKVQSSWKSSPERSDSDDAFSRNFPKINSAPSTRRIAKKTEQHFELLDEDLNWVVGSSHALYKAKTSKSCGAQSAKNLREQSFFCLLCSFHFSGIEAAVIHISSDDHADAIKQFGCNFVQVTPDSKFHCACCNRKKNRFYKIYNHILSEAHMDRICEINQETDEKSPVEFVAKASSDLETEHNDIDQSFSENSDLCSTGWPTFSEKPTSLNEETSSSLEISSCIFVTKRNAKKSYCHICESFEMPIATKNLENHINSMRHKFSLKRHGCENIESRKDGSYYCVCCDYEISNLQNVYLHIKDKKHMSSLIKVKQESKRVKKVTRTVSPADRFKTTGKPLLSEFIVKKICEPDEISDDDVYEPLEDSRQNLLPRYTGNMKKDLEKLNSISDQLDNSNQPLLNSMLITMADKLSQLSKQIADSNESALRDKSVNVEANRKRWITVKPTPCLFCKDSFSTLEVLHCHMAKHINEELVSMKNSSDLENSESRNPSMENSDPQSNSLTLDDLTDSPKSDRSSSSFDDSSSSGSDGELGELEGEERRPVWDREQYTENARKASSRKINLRAVLAELDFKDNYIYEFKDKLKDLEMGSRMLLVIDKETIYCLVCRDRVKNTLKDYSAHLWSLDHCSCLDLMEKDAAAFDEFPDQLSDLDLAHEYMEEISSGTVRCYLCNRDVENETEALRDHIYDDDHERACASTRANGLAIFETLKSSVKCDWYGVEQYTCLACQIRSTSDVDFVKHLNSKKHSKRMLRSPNVGSKMLFDYCLTCALLWYGYRSSYSYHVNEVNVHEWLTMDGFYLPNTNRKFPKTLLQHPEDEVDRLIRQLDGIRANEKFKEDSLVDDLQEIVRSTFPRAKAYTFGSRVTGLNSQDSDIDIFLDCREFLLVYDFFCFPFFHFFQTIFFFTEKCYPFPYDLIPQFFQHFLLFFYNFVH